MGSWEQRAVNGQKVAIQKQELLTTIALSRIAVDKTDKLNEEEYKGLLKCSGEN